LTSTKSSAWYFIVMVAGAFIILNYHIIMSLFANFSKAKAKQSISNVKTRFCG
jgi:hypothetical protein